MANDDTNPTRPSSTTRDAETDDAQVHAAADRMPNPEEEEAAERASAPDAEVSQSYEGAIERGARQKGEGRLP